MKRILFFLVIALFSSLCMAKYVAVLETAADPAAKDMISVGERQYLTNVLREQAVRILPAEQNWTIMTRENINAMLPPGKTVEDCEGSCLAETGKNIAADYVAQARVGKFGSNLTISCEIYETAGNKLVASFNGRSENVDGLVAEITARSPEFFKKVRGGSGDAWSGAGGFGNFSGAGRFSVAGKKLFVVNVATIPAGAMLSIDGRPVTKCSKTPCNVQVDAGEHRFVTVLDNHEDFDSLVTVNANDLQLVFSMMPNYGTLFVNPSMPGNAGNANDLKITIDGMPVSAASSQQLGAGVHAVAVSHPCYDPVEFNAAIEKGKSERFEQPLARAMGGLSLTAELNGEPQVVPVYIDGASVGSTPFLGEVPLCSRITVGDANNQKTVNVKLKFHETVEFIHNLDAPVSLSATEVARMKADAAEKDMKCEIEGDCDNKMGASIPANVKGDKKAKRIHWIPVGISAAAILGGTIVAVVKNAKAKDLHDKGPENIVDYSKKKDDIHSAQTARAVGIGIAIAGGIGLGLSFVF